MIIPEFDKDTYEMVLQNLPPEERQLLEMIVKESGGIDKFTEMVNAAGAELMIESNFDYMSSNPDVLDNMSAEEFEYFLGNEPVVTKAQEEMAWQATDELLSKFFNKA